MTDYQEEQAMEVEALESIYMEEFTKLKDQPLAFQLHVVPNQDGQNNHVGVFLKFAIPATYPDTIPSIDVVLEKGLSDTQLKELRVLLNQQMEENMGIAMAYTICEAVREYLIENNREGNDGSEYHEMLRRLELKQKKEDHAKQQADADHAAQNADGDNKPHFTGTPVTPETFAAWKATFEQELREKMTKSGVVKDEKTSKLTGRQLWSKGLVTEEEVGELGEEEIDGMEQYERHPGDDDEQEEGDDDDDDDEEDEENEDYQQDRDDDAGSHA